MGKGPKLRLSFLNSFQMCRPNDPSLLVKNPLPTVTYLYSPTNSNISFPVFPDPPPSTPNHISSKHNTGSSKITPLSTKSCMQNDEFSSHAYHDAIKEHNRKTYKFSSDSSEKARSIAASRTEKKKEKIERKVSTSTEILLAEIDENDEICVSGKPLKQRSVRTRRFKRYGSKDWKEGSIKAPANEPREKMAASGRLVPCMVDGKGNQSFVVVKRSLNPYEDFKKSMLEMILDKEIFEPEQLEQLLMSFLSLNSKMHHKVILEAFTEIWKEIFRSSK